MTMPRQGAFKEWYGDVPLREDFQRQVQQTTLVEVGRPDRPHKRQRQTARQAERDRREQDRQAKARGKETRSARVLRVLSWHWHRTQKSPTAYELLHWARANGEFFFDINTIRPRLTELVEQGLVAPGTKRRCEVTQEVVHTWQIREAGSQEPR